MNEKDLIVFNKTDNLLEDAKSIIQTAQKRAYQSANVFLLQRNWLLGYRIAVEEMKETRKENYGLEIINTLSKTLKESFGEGFSKSNLYSFYSFYKLYPNIFHAMNGKSFLSWTHYKILIQVKDEKARKWYEEEALKETWNYRTLQRNISSQYYYRLLSSQVKEPVQKEMQVNTTEYQNDTLEYIKNPVIAEFLGLSNNPSFTESALESAIINNIQKFLLELGKGYAFIARQQHIYTEKADYYIDLVFYNYILKCFILVDLKTSKITHQDVGQMDMYVRMYDELKKNKEDNPTLGIVLCSDTDEDIAKYSILNDNQRLFASKYKLYLPTEEELKKEIEEQKIIFQLQHNQDKK
ncbi:MAG: PDDEXK nuclease domain-containing protein [Roseburia sp.]|nr:PDDEXK nuclease domain-containing protein [Anaeroplasma bactoclasticum]MCM1196221.1 PDDEXK nuclease domain-containing protein [Roseburia sp.]MCM1556043.1 PDDEXK nuclease domain-containing protein [Anaeroplasma bactoclasticum]